MNRIIKGRNLSTYTSIKYILNKTNTINSKMNSMCIIFGLTLTATLSTNFYFILKFSTLSQKLQLDKRELERRISKLQTQIDLNK